MEPFIGQIMPVGFNFPPRGWAFCDGQLLAIASNTALFSLLGTTFGGDGRTTFGLPDLRGRSIVHPGNGPGLPTIRWGQRFGAPTHTLNVLELPAHNHIAGTLSAVVPANGEGNDGNNTALGGGGNEEDPILGVSARVNGVTGNTGNNQSFNMYQPSLGVYMCISLQGIFPSRN